MSPFGPKMKIVVLLAVLAFYTIKESNAQGLDLSTDDPELRDRLIRSGLLVQYDDFISQLPQSRRLASFDSSIGAQLSKFDWTKAKNAVSPVKNQGKCGSCVAFSMLANIESLYGIYHNINLDLSEEQFIECRADRAPACNGSMFYKAFETMERLGGVTTEENIPYMHKRTNKTHGCPATKPFWPKYGIHSYIEKRSPTEGQMKQWLVNFGPFMVGVTSDYIYNTPDILSKACNRTELNHAVLVVGFGEKIVNGKPARYWKVKNSWGKGGGDHGFYYIERGTNSHCIETRMVSPILADMMLKEPRSIGWNN